MRISGILQRKGSQVAVIAPDATITTAAAELARWGVGALVVSTDGETVAGILSERDIVRRLASPEAAGTMNSTVADLMTTDVVTCAMTDTTEELMAVMTEHRIRHIPVIDGDRLAGIISIGDVVREQLGALKTEAQQLHDYIVTGR